MNCTNAEHPDSYGHYREAKITAIKHHWWWKVSQADWFATCTCTGGNPLKKTPVRKRDLLSHGSTLYSIHVHNTVM